MILPEDDVEAILDQISYTIREQGEVARKEDSEIESIVEDVVSDVAAILHAEL